MSDAQEQEPIITCIHPEAVGKRYGDPISPERQAELQAIRGAWNAPNAQHGDRKGPFAGLRLTGADVSWLADQSGRSVIGWSPYIRLEGADLSSAHLEGALLLGAHLEGALLLGAHLEGADLSSAHLQGANLSEAHLEVADLSRTDLTGANLAGVHLKGTDLRWVNLAGANLAGIHLKGTLLGWANLEGAYLMDANLEGANLMGAHLERANLNGAHLEGAQLAGAHLERAKTSGANLKGAYLSFADLKGANLSGCWMDSKTVLINTTLDRMTKLGDIQWGGVGVVNLTQINWERVPTLGDEYSVGLRSSSDEHAATVRAYRQVATQLRAQGLSEVADRFSYRAQIRQRYLYLRTLIEDWRRPWRWPGDLSRYFGSFTLALLAGYGYRPGRTIVLYLLFIAVFAALYFAYGTGCAIGGVRDIALILAHQIPSGYACAAEPMSWNEAFVVSFTAFHGRGLLATTIKPSDPQAALAAAEAVLGLIIEVSFIATFTQRFFGSK